MADAVVPPPVEQRASGPLPDFNLPKPTQSKKKPVAPVGPALALSGGAAHGDFEVGVVRYLYEHGLVPKIICGTSIGAINGLKLAEGEPDGAAKPDADGHVQGLAGLIEIWKSLKYDSDMYKMLDPISKFIDVLKTVATGVAAGSLVGGSIAGPFGLFFGALAGGAIEKDTLENGLQTLLSTQSLGNFNPLDDLMQKSSSFKPELVVKSKIILRMVSTALEDGATRLVDEQGRLLESDGAQVNSGAVYDQATQDKINQIQDEINSIQKSFDDPDLGPPAKGQISDLPSLRAQLQAVEAAGKVIGEKPVKVPLRQGALASSSLPVFTPPQLFDDGKNYVDGGTKMVTPIQTALELGATVIYAVVASQDRMRPGVSFISHKPIPVFTSSNLVDIGLRVGGDIEPSAINDSQLRPPNGFPVPVLIFRPAWDIHDSFTIAPGLIDIRMDQGWMCADDVMQAWALDSENYLDLAQQYDAARGTTDIARWRHKIWIHEFAANGWQYRHDATDAPIDAKGPPPIPLDPTKNLRETIDAALARVRQMKQQLRGLVQARLDAHGNVPPGVERWWTDWERHTWKPTQVLWPLPNMTVKADPDKGVPLGKETTIKVTATDKAGAAIKGATVYAGGVKLGPAGSITTTFKGHPVKTIDPKTHAPGFSTEGPVVEVEAEGYETTPVAIAFDTAAAGP